MRYHGKLFIEGYSWKVEYNTHMGTHIYILYIMNIDKEETWPGKKIQ